MFFNGILHSAAQRSSIRSKLLFVASTTSLAVTGCLALQGPALAQDASDSSETVTVTATRVNRQGYEAPTPTTVVGPAQLEAQAQLNTIDYINNLPQMTPINQSGGTTSIGEQRPNFRGLGPTATLVLLDGIRMGDTDPQGGVDLDIMPTTLIQSIEVVSGGASADWGSDAVAGVMNFHLNTTLEGIKANFQCGESQYGDDQQCGGGVGAGAAFLNGKLHVVGAIDWESNTGVMDAPTSGRKWDQGNVALLYNTNYAAGNGQYQYFVSKNACYAQWNDAGIITGGPLKGITFTPQGQPEPFVYGTNTSVQFGQLFMQGGSCQFQHSMYVPSTTPPVHRQDGFTHLSYDINNNTSVYAEALYAHDTAFNQAIPNYDAGNLTISVQNAFLPASLKSLMVQNNVTTFTLGRWDPDFAGDNHGTSLFESENETNRYVVGGKGGIAGSWTWDAHVVYQRSSYLSHLFGSRNNTNWFNSVNSQINPATGLPICVSSLTNPTNGCVPVNVFGAGSISQGVASYVGGTATGLSYYTQTAGAVNIQGEPFDLPAGPVSVAGGFETRTEHLSVVVDATSALTQWRYQGLQNESGSYTVNEGYLEAVVPILKNVSFANDLSVNLAGRVTNYSTSGTVETWKIGANYTPFESGVIRFRGTLSVDIQAPTLNQLYSKQVQQGNGLINDPNFNNTQVLVLGYSGGNPNLIPEVARTKIFGVVLSPDFMGLDGLTLSADYYNITITNGIITLTNQQDVTFCSQGNASACAGVVRNAAGIITSVHNTYFNAALIQNQGVDMEGTYTRELSDWFADVPGSLTLHTLVAYNGEQAQTSGIYLLNQAGTTTAPMWNSNLSATYNVAPWQFYLQANMIGASLVEKTNEFTQYGGNPFYRANNHVSAYYTFDTTVQYQLNPGVQLYGGVDDLLNQSYPFQIGPNLTTTSGVGGSGFYDLIGRRFKLGVRFKT